MTPTEEGSDPLEKDPRGEPSLLRSGGGVVAVAKPAGLATQAPPGVPSAEAWLRGRLPRGAYVGVPHRLDRAVSGVLLLAVTPRAARKLSRQFERREIRKTYLALLTGPSADAPAEGLETVWWDHIAKIADEPRARIAPHGEPGSRSAETLVRFLGSPTPGIVSVQFEPLTGRMHQLRVQAASRGLPIVGDTLYGAPAGLHVAGEVHDDDPRRRQIALHAWRITYADPDTGESIRIDAPVPVGWPAIADAGDS